MVLSPGRRHVTSGSWEEGRTREGRPDPKSVGRFLSFGRFRSPSYGFQKRQVLREEGGWGALSELREESGWGALRELIEESG